MMRRRVVAGACVVSMMMLSAGHADAQESGRPVDTYNAASGMLSRGLDDLAIEEYRSFLERHPDHELANQARYGIAVAASRLGRHEEVLEAIGPVLSDRRFRFAMESALLAAQSHLATGDPAEASSILERASERYESHDLLPRAAGLLVESWYRAERPDRAIETYESYEGVFEGASGERASYYAGLSEARLGRHQEAADRFGRIGRTGSSLAGRALLAQGRSLQALGQLDRALTAYERSAAKSGEDAFDARLGSAQVLSDLGRHTEARDILSGIPEGGLQTRDRGRLHLERGRVSTILGEYDDAERALANVMEHGSQDLRDDAAYWRARAMLERGEADRASDLLTNAIEDYPRTELLPEMTYELGIAQGKAGQHEEAIRTLRRFKEQFGGHTLEHQALLAAASFAQNAEDQRLAGRLAEEAADGLEGESAHEAKFLAAESVYQEENYQEAARLYARLLGEIDEDHRLIDTVRYRLGMSLRQTGETEAAAMALRELFEQTDNPEKYKAGLLALGDMAYAGERWGEATEWLGRYVEFGPESPSWSAAALRLGMAHARDNDRRAAAEAFASIIEQDGDETGRARYELGLVLLSLDEPERARSQFQEAATSDDEEIAGFALRQLGELARSSGDDAGAAAYFAQAAETSEGEIALSSQLEQGRTLLASGSAAEAEEILSRLAESAEDVEIRTQAEALGAIASARAGHHERAIEHSERFARSGEVRKDLDDATAATLLYERGRSLNALENADAARGAFEELLESYPDERLTAHARLELAVLAMDAGEHEHAVELCAAILQDVEDADNAVVEQARYRLGVSAREIGEHLRAIEALYPLATREPVDRLSASAALLAGESNLALGKLAEAQSLFEIAEAFEDPSIRPVAILRLGEVFGGLQYWARAEETYGAFLDAYPEDDRVYLARFGRAWAVENQGRHEEAIAGYTQVVESHDGETAARAQFQIGECLYAQEQYEEAVKAFLRVDLIYDYPQWSAAALFEAGRCFEEMGRDADAVSQYADVIDRFRETDWASMSEKRIDRLTPKVEQGG